ncbi:MAG: hypothetical protein K8H85_17985 [Cyclobacteriaceae bacterium]|nr:hypothetical protein [Cyclobacteriaceae bacterium]
MLELMGGILLILAGNFMFYYWSIGFLRDENDLGRDHQDGYIKFRAYASSIGFVITGLYILVDARLFGVAGVVMVILSFGLVILGIRNKLIDLIKGSNAGRAYLTAVIIESTFSLALVYAEFNKENIW